MNDENRPAELDEETLTFAAKVFQLARDGDPMELRDMLAQGLPPDLRNESGDSLLMLAAYNGNEGGVRALLEHGADPNLPNDKGQVPLAGVAFKGEHALVKMLIEGGALVDGPQETDRTPLMVAAMFDKTAIAEILLANGADPDRRDGGGLSVLDLAKSMGAAKIGDVIARWKSQGATADLP